MRDSEAPRATRLPVSAGELVCSLLVGTRVGAFYTTVAEDVVGGLLDGQGELLAESVQGLLAHGLRAYAGARGEYLQGALDELELFERVAPPEVYREAVALATENPETIDGMEDLARRVMTFIECRLDVEPVYHWWDGPWNPQHQARHWDTWGPVVRLAAHVGVNSLGMSLESALEVAEELEAQKEVQKEAQKETQKQATERA